jgi:chitinase
MINQNLSRQLLSYPLIASFSLLFFLFACSAAQQQQGRVEGMQATPPPVLIGYVHGNRVVLDGAKVPAEQLTHINYAFANIAAGEIVEGSPEDAVNLKMLNGLKRRNPALKILVSVGGWSWSGGFSDAVLDEPARERFANSAIALLQRHQLDGIDLDWEYPGQIGAGNTFRPEDKQNFTLALRRIREKLDSLGQGQTHYLLTIATGANQLYLDHTEMEKAQAYLDFINIMTYDFHGGWQPRTGHHANLHFSIHDDNPQPIAVAEAVGQHIAAGIPVQKLVVGVPFYGRWWAGAKPVNHGLYQPADGPTGAFPYHFLVDSLIDKNGYQRHWDSIAQAPFLWNEASRTFVTYEDTISFGHKVHYIREKSLAGLMFWEYKQDDGSLVDFLYRSLNAATDKKSEKPDK